MKRSRIFEKKYPGMSLIELMLVTVLASIIFIMLYQAYNSVYRSVQFARNVSALESKKSLIYFHCFNDIASLVLPPTFVDAVLIAAEEKKKKEKKKTGDAVDAQTEEKEKEKIKKKFDQCVKRMPTVLKDEKGEFHCSFMTTRMLFTTSGARHSAWVTYTLKKTEAMMGEEPLYVLMRKEEDIVDEKNKGEEFVLADMIVNPTISLYVPVMPPEKKEEQKTEGKEKGEGKKETKEPPFELWYKNPVFKKETTLALPTIATMITQAPCPYYIMLEGVLVSEDGGKRLPFVFALPIAVAEDAFITVLHHKLLLKEKEMREKNRTGEKKEKNDSEKGSEEKDSGEQGSLEQGSLEQGSGEQSSNEQALEGSAS